MSKIQRGNKEAKKPKQAMPAHKDILPSAMALTPPSLGVNKHGAAAPKK